MPSNYTVMLSNKKQYDDFTRRFEKLSWVRIQSLKYTILDIFPVSIFLLALVYPYQQKKLYICLTVYNIHVNHALRYMLLTMQLIY